MRGLFVFFVFLLCDSVMALEIKSDINACRPEFKSESNVALKSVNKNEIIVESKGASILKRVIIDLPVNSKTAIPFEMTSISGPMKSGKFITDPTQYKNCFFLGEDSSVKKLAFKISGLKINSIKISDL